MKKVIFGMVAALALTANAAAQDVPVVTAVAPIEGATVMEIPQAPAAQAPTPQTPQPTQTPQAAAAPATGFQVVRPGDSQMSCEALIAEANALNAQMTAMQSAMTDRAMNMSRSQLQGMQTQMGASTAMSLGSMAASFIPGAGLALGAAQSVAGLAQRAAAAAAQQQRMSAMDDMMADVQAGTSQMMPLMNRADHLTDLSIAKRC